MIQEIQSNDRYIIKLKDCSLGKGFPVIALVIFDMLNKKYLVNFGSHPIFEVALMRVFTEIFQGKSLDDICIPIELEEEYDFDFLNVGMIMSNGMGHYPPDFFSKLSSYKFSNKHFIKKATSNVELLHHYSTFLKKNNMDVLVRNNTFLDFPAIQIFIPGYSEIFLDLDFILKIKDKIKSIRRSFKTYDKLGSIEIKSILFFIDYLRKTIFNRDGISVFFDTWYRPETITSVHSDIFFLLYGYLDQKLWNLAIYICNAIYTIKPESKWKHLIYSIELTKSKKLTIDALKIKKCTSSEIEEIFSLFSGEVLYHKYFKDYILTKDKEKISNQEKESLLVNANRLLKSKLNVCNDFGRRIF